MPPQPPDRPRTLEELFRTSAWSENDHRVKCCICQEPYRPRFERPVELYCGHVVGEECITTWVEDRHSNSCPQCRSPILASLPSGARGNRSEGNAAERNDSIGEGSSRGTRERSDWTTARRLDPATPRRLVRQSFTLNEEQIRRIQEQDSAVRQQLQQLRRMIETLSPREEQPRNQEATQEQRLTRLSSLLWTQYSVQPTEAERRRVEQQYQHLILDGRPGFLAFLSSTQILLWKIYDETVSKIETTSANWAQSEINANYIPGISDRSVGVSTGWTILFLEMMKGSGFMPYQSLVQRIEQGDNWALIWNIIKDAPSFRRNKQRLSYLLAHEYMQEIIRCRRLIDPGDIQTASWKGRTERAVAQLQERLDRMSRRSFTQRQGLNTTTTTRRL